MGDKVLLISNPEIFGHYGDICLQSLQAAGFETCTHLIPPGEEHKHLQSIQQVYDTALANHLERSSTFVALGGGVIGDMTGFAAATWLRGGKLCASSHNPASDCRCFCRRLKQELIIPRAKT